ncbi:MAG: BatA and WFA domain-containing protein [Phycisphaerae bacterium]|nr:BatA and WFA domain-containing protein [Phycisphaerae bacterium]
MSFLNLWALWIAAAVVPALLILYFLKLRRREELVPSTLLWKRAVQDLQVNAPFQRLRKNLLLFLQLLILALAIVALARPIVETTVADEERVVLLIDHSASMNTREGDQTRLDQAKEQAIRLVKTFNRRTSGWRSFFSLGGAEAKTQVMVIAFADRASIVSPFTTNTGDLVDLIERIEPTDGRTNLAEVLELAEAYMAPPTMTTDKTPISAETPSKLVLISDGRVADLDQLVLKSGTMEWRPIGDEHDNVGITSLWTLRNYERPEILNVLLTVRNFGPEPVSTDVRLYVDDTLAKAKRIELAAKMPPDEQEGGEAEKGNRDKGNAISMSFDLELNRAAVIKALLRRDDALPVDNTAYAVVPPPRKVRVLVVTERNMLLDAVLSGLPLREYPFIRPDQWEANAADKYEVEGQCTYDVVIIDKYQPQRLPAGNYLFLKATPIMDGFEVGEALKYHPLIWWDETHPVLRHVALEHVYVGESMTLKVPQQAEVLAEGPQGPVLVRYAHDGRHCVVLTFAIENSTWWTKQSFGIFMYNVIRYLGSGGAEVDRKPTQPGETLRIPIPAEADQVLLATPSGEKVALTPDTAGVAYFSGTERAGVYQVEEGVPGRDRFAVNLEDDSAGDGHWEGDIAPLAGVMTVDVHEITRIEAIKTATPEVWRWFIGVALALVLVEWWIYNRRVMI